MHGWGSDEGTTDIVNNIISDWNDFNVLKHEHLKEYAFKEILIDTKEVACRRTHGSNSEVKYKTEIAKIGLGGIIDFREFEYDAELVRQITIIESDGIINIHGGIFVLSGEGNKKHPGFLVKRSRVRFSDNYWRSVNDVVTTEAGEGLYHLTECVDIYLDNIQTFLRGNNDDLSIDSLNNYICRSETVMNVHLNKVCENGGWLWTGTAGNNIKSMTCTNCHFRTWDVHWNGCNITLKDCTFMEGTAIKMSATGTTIIDGCRFIMPAQQIGGTYFLEFRNDYVCKHTGDLTIRNCVIDDYDLTGRLSSLIKANLAINTHVSTNNFVSLPTLKLENITYNTMTEDKCIDILDMSTLTFADETSTFVPFGEIICRNLKSYITNNERTQYKEVGLYRFKEPAISSGFDYLYNPRYTDIKSLYVLLDNVSLINNRSENRPNNYSSAYGIVDATDNISGVEHKVIIDIYNSACNMRLGKNYIVNTFNSVITNVNIMDREAQLYMYNSIVDPVLDASYNTWLTVKSPLTLYDGLNISLSDCVIRPPRIKQKADDGVVSYVRQNGNIYSNYGIFHSLSLSICSNVMINSVSLDRSTWAEYANDSLNNVLVCLNTGTYADIEVVPKFTKNTNLDNISTSTNSYQHTKGYLRKGEIYDDGEHRFKVTSSGYLCNAFAAEKKYSSVNIYKQLNGKIYLITAAGTTGTLDTFTHSDEGDITWGTLVCVYVSDAGKYTTL